MNKGLIINEDVWPMIDDLEPEEKTELLIALSAYYQGEAIPPISRITNMVFKRIAIDNTRFDPEHRQRLSEIRAEAGRKGGSKPKQTEAKEANGSKNSKTAQDKIRKDKEKEEIREDKSRVECVRFAPPTVEEVDEYIRKKGYHFDAEAFVAHYKSKGWKVGSEPMKDWKAACVTWEKKETNRNPKIQQAHGFSTERKTNYNDLVWNNIRAEWEAAE